MTQKFFNWVFRLFGFEEVLHSRSCQDPMCLGCAVNDGSEPNAEYIDPELYQEFPKQDEGS